MANPTTSGRPFDSHGCMITTTPTNPATTASTVRRSTRSAGSRSIVKSTAESGVVAFPMPASADDTRSSPNGNRVNGTEQSTSPATKRCPQTRPHGGSRTPMTSADSSTVAAPATIRRVEIWTGASACSPIFMSRNEPPQIRASAPNLTCQGTLTSRPVRRAPVRCRCIPVERREPVPV